MAKSNGRNGNGNGNGKKHSSAETPKTESLWNNPGGGFKKGNPGGGRPPGPNLNLILRRMLDEPGPIQDRSKAEAGIAKVIAAFLAGERWAAELVWDRIHGKAVERVLMTETEEIRLTWGDYEDSPAAATPGTGGNRLKSD